LHVRVKPAAKAGHFSLDDAVDYALAQRVEQTPRADWARPIAGEDEDHLEREALAR